jgi:hypothetical protein
MKQKGAVDQKLCLICITSSPHHFITPADKEAMSEWGCIGFEMGGLADFLFDLHRGD